MLIYVLELMGLFPPHPQWSHTDMLHTRTYTTRVTMVQLKSASLTILLYFYSKTNWMHQYIKFILFRNDTTCFGRSFHQSSGVQVCTYSNHTDTAVCLLATSWQQYLFYICLLLYAQSWNCRWWTERPSETCRVSFQNKINLIHWCIYFVLL